MALPPGVDPAIGAQVLPHSQKFSNLKGPVKVLIPALQCHMNSIMDNIGL